MDGCFSQDYGEAQKKFAAAARIAGAEVTAFALDKRGPDGGKLSTDVAWLGPPDAHRVLVTISGTHGVEGFFGSATQIECCVVLRRLNFRKVSQRCIFMQSVLMDSLG
jgi:hypothetical protein